MYKNKKVLDFLLDIFLIKNALRPSFSQMFKVSDDEENNRIFKLCRNKIHNHTSKYFSYVIGRRTYKECEFNTRNNLNYIFENVDITFLFSFVSEYTKENRVFDDIWKPGGVHNIVSVGSIKKNLTRKFWSKLRVDLIERLLSNEIKDVANELIIEDVDKFLKKQYSIWKVYYMVYGDELPSKEEVDYSMNSSNRCFLPHILDISNENMNYDKLEIIWNNYYKNDFSENSSIHEVVQYIDKSTTYEYFEENLIDMYTKNTADFMIEKLSEVKKTKKSLNTIIQLNEYKDDFVSVFLERLNEFRDELEKDVPKDIYVIKINTELTNYVVKTKDSTIRNHIFEFSKRQGYNLFTIRFIFEQKVSGKIKLSEMLTLNGYSIRKQGIKTTIYNADIVNLQMLNLILNKIHKHLIDIYSRYKWGMSVDLFSTDNYSIQNKFLSELNSFIQFEIPRL